MGPPHFGPDRQYHAGEEHTIVVRQNLKPRMILTAREDLLGTATLPSASRTGVERAQAWRPSYLFGEKRRIVQAVQITGGHNFGE